MDLSGFFGGAHARTLICLSYGE